MARQEMVFSDYLRIVLKRKWTVLLSILLVFLAALYLTKRKPDTYKSHARIEIQRLQSFPDLFEEILVSSADPIENYVYEITGHNVLTRAAGDLTAQGTPTEHRDLTGAVTAERIERTNMIDIEATASKKTLSRDRCKAVVEAFITIHDSKVTANAREQYAYIQDSLEETTDNLADLDREFREYIEEGQITSAESEEVNILTEKLIDARIALGRLREKGNYTEEYPEIVSLRNTIKSIQSQLDDAVTGSTRSRSALRDYRQRRKILEDLAALLTQKREEARLAMVKKSERVGVIEPPAEGEKIGTSEWYLVSVGLLLGLMLGVVLAFVAENLDTSIRTLVDIEDTFHLPILGVVPHFSPHDQDVPIRPEGLWHRIKYSETVTSMALVGRSIRSAMERKTGKQKKRSPLTTLVVPFSPRSPATEGYRAVRTNLHLGAENARVGAILMTSPGPAEGKSTTSANLACAFAQSGKRTLLVGANMRRPSLYRTFGLKREGGLSEILTEEISWREALRDHRDLALGERREDNLATMPGAQNLFFITSGGRTTQPAEWLSLPSFAANVAEWEKEFDIVLIDGTPILPVPDSIIMASTVKRAVLVYQAGSSQRDSMIRAISLLNKTGTAVCGMVLNDLRASWSVSPDYFHYRGYYGRPEK
ncbi:MAG: polysaccharide biosynthesis tyrosine autokinase [Kiritimatiellia bacterium]